MTWRRSPLAPRPTPTSPLPAPPPPIFFVLLTSLLFCSNKKWHTVEIRALCPCGAFSRCSPVYSSAQRERERENSLLAVYFCTCTQWVCMWVMYACSCLYMCYETLMHRWCCIQKEGKVFKNCWRSSEYADILNGNFWGEDWWQEWICVSAR